MSLTDTGIVPNMVRAVLLGAALFLGAIFTGNFWLSLILGIGGGAAFAYAFATFRAYRAEQKAARRTKVTDA